MADLYSPEDVTILLGGIYKVEGLTDGSFVQISEEEARYKTTVTADGMVSRTHVKNPTHRVTLTTNSTADVNNVLSAWASSDGLLFGAMIPLFIKDGLGTTMFYAPLSWIEEVPVTDMGVDVNERAWVIRTAGATSIVGGNGLGGVVDTNLAALGMLAADFGGLL